MFTFITADNLKAVIKTEFYNNLVAGLSQTELDRIEGTAISTIKDKLRGRYDVAAIFSGVPKDDRIIQWIVNIMIYQLHRRQNPRAIPENISADYQDTITWLNDIRDLREHPDFPPLPNDELGAEQKGANDLRFGSKKPFEFGEF
jgi:hypothetical protein